MFGITPTVRSIAALALMMIGTSSAYAQSACIKSAQNSVLDPPPWQLRGGASRDGGLSYVSSVNPGENIDVFIELNPLAPHIGRHVELYLLVASGLAADITSSSLVRTRQSFSMNADLQLVPAAGLDSLQPLAVDLPLQMGQRLKVFSGTVDQQDGFRVQALYCVDGNVFYSSGAVGFAVDYNGPQSLQVDFPPVSGFAFSGATLNFRGDVLSSVPYAHATVELERAGQPTLVTTVLPGGRWTFDDVPVTAAMTMSLKVNGQIVDRKQYMIDREPGWSDLEGFALDTANRLAYVVDAGNRQLFTVNLDSGARTLLRPQQPQTTTGSTLPVPLADVAVVPATGKLWVSSSGTPLLREFDNTGWQTSVHAFDVSRGSNPEGGIVVTGNEFPAIEYSQQRKMLYTVERNSGRVYAYEATTRQTQLLAQLPGVPLSTVGSGSASGVGALSIAGITDIALDETNDRLLAISIFSKKVWAVDLTSGVVTEVFDQDKASIVGTAPRKLSTTIPPNSNGNVLVADGFIALAHDGKRNLWLLAKRQELLGANLDRNTVTQVLDPVTNPGSFVGEMRDLGYDDVRDRYVYVDGALNTISSYDPVMQQVQRLSGKATIPLPVFSSQPVLAPAAQNTAVVYSSTATGSLNVIDFRNESWVPRYLSPIVNGGIRPPLYTPIGTDNVVRDFVPAAAKLAYDASRNRHVLLTSTGTANIGPPINTPTLGIRGIPGGTVAGGGRAFIPDPAAVISRIFSIDLGSNTPTPIANAPYEELVPVYAGDNADIRGLIDVAVKGDGSQYMFSNIVGELFTMNPATRVMTKLPAPPLPVSATVLAYVGDTLMQIDALGGLYAVNTDARSADYGKRSLVSGVDKGSGPLLPAASSMIGAMSNNSVYISGQHGVIGVVDTSNGNRSLVSSVSRGEGDALHGPGNVVMLRDPKTLYVTEAQGLVIIDLDSGDRIVLE